MQKTVLITGAQGRFGRAAAEAFAHAGWRVLAQVRRPWNNDDRRQMSFESGGVIEPITVALADTAALVQAAGAASVVIHAVNPPYTAWTQWAMPLLQQSLAVAQALGAVFMLPGNVYNYGTQIPEVLHDDTVARPDHAKAQVRVAMEAAMSEAAAKAQEQGSKLRCVVVRAGDFFGAGTGSWFDLAIVKDLQRGKLVYPGPRDVPHAWAYLPDLAAAFERVATHVLASSDRSPPFQAYHFEGHTLTGEQLLAALVEASRELQPASTTSIRYGSVPWPLIRFMGLFRPMMRELASMRYLWSRPHRLDGSRLQRTIELAPPTPLAQALKQSLLDLGWRAA